MNIPSEYRGVATNSGLGGGGIGSFKSGPFLYWKAI